RDQSKRHWAEVLARLHFKPRAPVNDSRGILQASKQRMMRCSVVLEAQVSVLQARFNVAGEIDSKQIGKAEVFAPDAILTAKARLVRGDNAAAAPNESAELGALFVRKRSDVRQDQRL